MGRHETKNLPAHPPALVSPARSLPPVHRASAAARRVEAEIARMPRNPSEYDEAARQHIRRIHGREGLLARTELAVHAREMGEADRLCGLINSIAARGQRTASGGCAGEPVLCLITTRPHRRSNVLQASTGFRCMSRIHDRASRDRRAMARSISSTRRTLKQSLRLKAVVPVSKCLRKAHLPAVLSPAPRWRGPLARLRLPRPSPAAAPSTSRRAR